MRAWLRSKGYDISTDTKLRAIEADDAQRVGMADQLMQALQPRERGQMARHQDNGPAMWRALLERFQTLSMAERTRIVERLTNTRLEAVEEVETYLARKASLIQQLRDSGETWGAEAEVMQLLGGLGPSFDEVRQAMEMKEPGQRTVATCERLIRVRAAIAQSSASVEAANVASRVPGSYDSRDSSGSSDSRGGSAARGNRGGRGGPRAMKCYTCGKTGHTRATCRFTVCFTCGQTGHIASKCEKEGANATTVIEHGDVQTSKAGMDSLLDEAEQSERHSSEEEPRNEHALVNASTRTQAEVLSLMRNHGAWLVDSGTSSHMTPNRALLSNYSAAHGAVNVANSESIKIAGRGTVTMSVPDVDGGVQSVRFEALHVPDLAYNLFSTAVLIEAGGGAVLDDQPRLIWPGTKPVKCERWRPRTLLVPVEESHITLTLLHERMAHVNRADCIEVAEAHKINFTGTAKELCTPCCEGKAKRANRPKVSTERNVEPLELVAVDAGGPFKKGLRGERNCADVYRHCLGLSLVILYQEQERMGETSTTVSCGGGDTTHAAC